MSEWDDTAIPLLSVMIKNAQCGYAQCAEGCGFVFQDDVPVYVADLPCPVCRSAYLHRWLSIEQLLPKSKFPRTFTLPVKEEDPMDDDEYFLGYVSLHSHTPRALFSRAHVERLYRLAGEDSPLDDCCHEETHFFPIHNDVAQPLIDRARLLLNDK